MVIIIMIIIITIIMIIIMIIMITIIIITIKNNNNGNNNNNKNDNNNNNKNTILTCIHCYCSLTFHQIWAKTTTSTTIINYNLLKMFCGSSLNFLKDIYLSKRLFSTASLSTTCPFIKKSLTFSYRNKTKLSYYNRYLK